MTLMRFIASCGLILMTLITGCARFGAVDAARKSMQADALVTINGFEFVPKSITIKSGQTVEWNNTAAFETHTITADPKLAKKSEDIALPAGAEPFNSGDLSPGAVYRHTFTVPGTYRYICIPHEGMGMIGQIEVK